jgi:acyl-homoserine lactone acylase PvdQ
LRSLRVAIAVALAALAAAAPARAVVQPYGTNDAGGFRNVLPPGEAGTDNAVQLAAYEAAGARPQHWDDQQPLYEGLLYASPTLTHDQIPQFFKDATFGVKLGDVASSESPRAGVTIVRDASYGVAHVYGDTDEDVEFGAGYASAEDRLFLMDVLRHYARGQLSSFAGGSASNREMDREQWAAAPYTEADLQRQIDLAPQLYGEIGRRVVGYVNAYVAGINAYIAKARTDPTLLPSEYVAFQQTPQDFKPTDVVAEASLIGGIFGKGGGREVASAQALEAFTKRFGTRRGRRAWSDFRSKNDPEAPTTVIGRRFPYETGSPFSRRGLAMPDPGSVQPVPVGPPLDAPASASRVLPPHASNWELVDAKHSATGHAIGVLGPQVGYYDPQILMELDLHGPHFDARGATFPGVSLVVQLGHGRDYAWSATTADTDNVDTFAEVLCQDDVHYRWRGRCLPMDKLQVTNSWSPSVGSSAPAGSETLTAYRTVHGIVYARGTVHGRKVAFVQARTTYFPEADSAIGFFCLNDPACVHDPQSFRGAIDDINFGFNWAYIDANHIAYQQSGWYPRRARGVSPDFPVFGTGAYDWKGFDPDLHTQAHLSADERPHALDQPYLVSWNGKQAPGWAAADDLYFWGSLQRQQMIQAHIRADLAHGRKATLEQVVQAMEESATQDLRGLYDLPWMVRAMGRVTDPKLRDAIALLQRWRAGGAHRRDLDRNGVYDDDAAVTLMDAWWPKAVQAEFGGVLGPAVVKALHDMVPFDAELDPGASPSAPSFETGWYGYVNKDLRDLLRPRSVRGRWSRVYCGSGSRRRCARALQRSLADALTVTRAQLYGRGDCASNPQASCFDRNRPSVASAIDMPAFPLQNRPTFQQTAEPTRILPR